MAETYGPLVRLWGVHPSQLPPASARGDDLKSFLAALLGEALPFLDFQNPRRANPWRHKSTRSFSNSAAPVMVFQRTVAGADLAEHSPPGKAAARDEFWALRMSRHADGAADGTASWGEFVRCFKEEHAAAEMAFTPSVVGTALEREWDCKGVEIEVEAGEGEGGGGGIWRDWTLKRESSTHRLGGPLRKRVFPVVQATAAREGRREIVIVQVAVRRGDDDDSTDGNKEEAGTVRGAYSSVEIIRETDDGMVEWIMGTASDAAGWVPQRVQNLAVPGQIAKDVDMFMRWVAEERKKREAGMLKGV